jgi:hypothetical protein
MPVLNQFGVPGINNGRNVNYSWDADPDMMMQESLNRKPGSSFSQQLATARLPHELAQQRFNTVLPYLTNALGNFSSTVGGQSPPSPEITVGPVWNSQQIQQQANAMRARNDQATQSRIQGTQQNMAARGFGNRSPLLAALGAQYQNQNLAANSAGERDLRWNAAQGNAQNVQQTQVARSNQFAQRQQEDIERRRQALGSQSAMLSALAGLV